MFEALVGDYLQELGYPLLTSGKDLRSPQIQRMKRVYSLYFSTRFLLKNSGLARRIRGPISSQEVDEIVMGADHPAKLFSTTVSEHNS